MILIQSDLPDKVFPPSQRTKHQPLFQDLVVFPGPSPDNLVSDDGDHERRRLALAAYVHPDGAKFPRLISVLNQAYAARVTLLCIDVAFGGQRDVTMPTIMIDMIGTYFNGRNSGVNGTTPEHAIALSRLFYDDLQLDWCEAWFLGNFRSFKISLDRHPLGPIITQYRLGRSGKPEKIVTGPDMHPNSVTQ